MEKVSINVCYGTTCFVMGASKLQELGDLIPFKYKDKVEVKASNCLDLCKNFEYMKAPFVKIDDEIISEATIEKILSKLEQKLEVK